MKNDGVLGTLVSTILHAAILIVAVVLIYRGAVMCYEYGYRIFQEPPISKGEGRVVSVTIPADYTVTSMASLLESKGLIRDSKLLILQYFCSEYREDIKAGTYELNTAMTAEEMFSVMAGEVWEADTDDN